MSVGSIAREGSAYRKGLILGFTMAEIMLLVAFCLLIAAGASLSHTRKISVDLDDSLRETRRENAGLRESLAKAKGELETIQKATIVPEAVGRSLSADRATSIDEFWRKVVDGHEAYESLLAAGLDARKALETAQKLRDRQAEVAALRQELRLAAARLSELDKAIKALGLDAAALPADFWRKVVGGYRVLNDPKKGGKGVHDWPPIITLNETRNHNFASGDARLTQEFEREIRTSVIDRLLDITARYDVDVIEVVGHTDEQGIAPRNSNLDGEIVRILRGGDVGALRPADNAGLGIARAVAVTRILIQDQRLGQFRILPLSGAQLIENGDKLTTGKSGGDVRERRRIEIRVRKGS